MLRTYAAGRTTALVLDVGDRCASAVPVHEGFALTAATVALPVAGRDVTAHLQKALRVDEAAARAVKESACAVRGGGADEAALPATFTLPDGTAISLGDERFAAPEVLFAESPAAPQAVVDAVAKCDKDYGKELYPALLLAGGSTLLPGFGLRLHAGVLALAPTSKATLADAPHRLTGGFVGASILTSITAFTAMFVSRADYDAKGGRVVHDKCPASGC